MRSSRSSKKSATSISRASNDSSSTETEDLSISSKRTIQHIFARYNWKSNLEYMGSVLVYSINIYNYHRMQNKSERTSIPMLHFFVLMMVYALPLQYMQVTQGQFVQAGATFLKYLCPIAYGLGYMFILSTMLRLVYVAVLGSDFMLYFFFSLQFHTPWFNCPKDHEYNCWDNFTCNQKQPCLSKDIVLSTTAYWNYTYMYTVTDKLSYSGIYLRRFAALAIFWGVITWTLLYKMNTVCKSSTRAMFAFCICIIIIIVISLICTEGAIWGIVRMFHFSDVRVLLDYHVWSETISIVITSSGLAKGGYILLGSYLHPNAPSGILTVLNVIIYVLTFTLLEVLAQTSLCLTLTRANLTMKDRESVLASNRPYEIFELTITPKGFQFIETPNLITMLYFLMCIILSGVFVVMNVKIMEVCIDDCHPQLMRYRNYILILYYLLNLLISLLFMINGLFKTAILYFTNVLDLLECLNVLLYTLITAWIYSVQHLSDDIHYISGAQPSKYWKFCWFASPVITALGFAYTVFAAYDKIVLIALFVLYMPFILMGGVQAFKYIKQRNLFGLFQAEERWGPPDSTHRNNRRIFNPRKEIRSRRRFDKCMHNCLLDSKILKRVKDDATKYYDTQIGSPPLNY